MQKRISLGCSSFSVHCQVSTHVREGSAGESDGNVVLRAGYVWEVLRHVHT
jgi:hypothetical protein